jgi:hypothetical protein
MFFLTEDNIVKFARGEVYEHDKVLNKSIWNFNNLFTYYH